METILAFFILLVIGLVLQYLKIFPTETDKSLNLYVIYISLPAVILQQVPRLQFSFSTLTPIAMSWLVVLFSSLSVLLLCRFMKWSRETTGALMLMVPLGNTSFLGIPMVERFFGSSGVPYAILYDQFGSFLALSSYGTLVLALYSSGTRPGLLAIVKKFIFFPPFLALIAALCLQGSRFPDWLQTLLSMTAKSMLPVVLVAIGFQMRLLLPKDEILPFTAGLILRLLITPIFFLFACKLFNLSGPAVRVSLLETAMPPMVMAGAMASIAGLKPRLSSAMAAYGILVSFFTLPLIYSWL